MAKIVIIGALAESLYNFRGELIRSLIKKGNEVVAMSGSTTIQTQALIEGLGASFMVYPVSRNGFNPLDDMTTFLSFRKAIKKIKPDIVLAYTIKPVIWGGLAVRSTSSKLRFYALITGTGYSFQGESVIRIWLKNLVSILYRTALMRADKVIYQNTDNFKMFVENRLVSELSCRIVNGSGVDTSHYAMTPLPDEGFVFLLIARLLCEKGLREYAEAAKIVKKSYPDVVFNLIGPEDSSPDRISIHEVKQWHESGIINYCGVTQDVRFFIAGCHVYVLPSYHEGLPRTVIEAMSMGRPVLTTDVPGCRETVVQGENGYLVPHRNAGALAEKMIWFIKNKSKLHKMGKKSRERAEDKYDVRKVNDEMLRIMGLN